MKMSETTAQDRYAVIGYPVSHSWSPFIHGMSAKRTNQHLPYSRIAAAPEASDREVAAFLQTGGKRLNATVPHKPVAALMARYRSPRAEIAGAVNTLLMEGGAIHGDNTDGAGFVTDLTRNLGLELEGIRILIIGAGGAARGVLGPILGAAPEYVEIANRNEARALELARGGLRRPFSARTASKHGHAIRTVDGVQSASLDVCFCITCAASREDDPCGPNVGYCPVSLDVPRRLSDHLDERDDWP